MSILLTVHHKDDIRRYFLFDSLVSKTYECSTHKHTAHSSMRTAIEQNCIGIPSGTNNKYCSAGPRVDVNKHLKVNQTMEQLHRYEKYCTIVKYNSIISPILETKRRIVRCVK